MKHKQFFTLTATTALVISALTLLLVRTNAAKTVNKTNAALLTQQSVERDTLHIRPGRILPQLHVALRALGDRLEQPSKERLTVIGVLRQDESPPAPFTLISELPGQARLTLQNGIGQRTFTFDGQSVVSSDGSLNQRDFATLETLVYDTAERFFVGQMASTTPRALGINFRADDGTAPNYTGPFYDIYQVTDNIKTDPTLRRQNKLYCFNSATQLLERVRYTEIRSGKPVRVEVQIDDWRPDQNQQIPRRITRLENDVPVLTLTIASTVVGSKLEDGTFAAH